VGDNPVQCTRGTQVRSGAESRKSHAKRGLSGTSHCARCQDRRVV